MSRARPESRRGSQASEEVAPAAESEGEGRGHSVLRELQTLGIAIALALVIRAFLFQSFYVPSDSMFPTLLVGDHVFVNKFVYGPRIPFTAVRLPGLREPERGEVVVFRLARGPSRIHPPDRRPELHTEAFVKRLVGLPGDRVAVREGQVFLNGAPVPLRDTGEHFVDASGRRFDVLVERLGDCRHRVLDAPDRPGPDMAPLTVPEGRYLFLGDNRDNSHDGRSFGTVSLAHLEGPAGLLYWSWDWNGSWLALLNPLTWWENLTSRTRWGRMGGLVGCGVGGPVPPGPGAD